MKIVQSYWSKPSIVEGKENGEKTHGGWREKKYEYMSWALSCLTFNKLYPTIELVTDVAGKKLLIDQLQLPYKSVKVVLDCLNKYPKKLWAIGKLYAYGIQNEPFIHVDNDIFIWEKFGPEIENAPLVAQHVDDKEDHYHTAIKNLKKQHIEIPETLTNDLKMFKRFDASNAGIIGGNDIVFFKEFVKEAFHFIDANLAQVDKNLNGSSYAILYEQYLFSALARKHTIKIQHLFEGEDKKSMDLVNFMNKYARKKYVHMYSISKFYPEYCRELEHQLLLEYPEYHQRIISLIADENRHKTL